MLEYDEEMLEKKCVERRVAWVAIQSQKHSQSVHSIDIPECNPPVAKKSEKDIGNLHIQMNEDLDLLLCDGLQQALLNARA